jgi:hypothetical protein
MGRLGSATIPRRLGVVRVSADGRAKVDQAMHIFPEGQY